MLPYSIHRIVTDIAQAALVGDVKIALFNCPEPGVYNSMKIKYLFFSLSLLALDINADSWTLDAAIGSGIGAAAGAAIGNEIGGRDAAIIGGALGGAVGAAFNTREDGDSPTPPPNRQIRHRSDRGDHPHAYHCPPGQRKKGRC